MRRVRGLGAISLALLLVFAGCSAPFSEPGPDAPGGGGPGAPDDPPSDRLGWEAGYWHDESVDVDQSDGLNESEMEAYVARAMARVEYIRGTEFDERVPVNVITREEFRNRNGGGGSDGDESSQAGSEFSAWNNQVWEALFIAGESTDSQASINETYSGAIAGFYSPSDDEIKIVTDDASSASVDNATLVHELVHALQDQQYDLSSKRFRAQTQDGELAIDGVVEGDAKYVEQQYVRRCGEEWSCVAAPSDDGGGEDGASAGGGRGSAAASGGNLGMLLTIYQPYSDGPVYVHDLVEEGGWDAVNRSFRNPPASTEQTIHLTDEEPVPIEFTDRARDGWRTFPNQGENGSDTVGEASMFSMFWYQARTAGADTVNPRSIADARGPYDTYNYDAAPSAGWGNDRLFPYRKSAGGDTRYGYVWVTEWDSRQDAREFRRTYLEILRAHDVNRRADGTYVLPDGEFADAFRVHREGSRVVIVNGPTPQAVDDIRPNLAA